MTKRVAQPWKIISPRLHCWEQKIAAKIVAKKQSDFYVALPQFFARLEYNKRYWMTSQVWLLCCFCHEPLQSQIIRNISNFAGWSCIGFRSARETQQSHLESSNLVPWAVSKPLFQSSAQKTILAQRVVCVGVFETADIRFLMSNSLLFIAISPFRLLDGW